MVNIRLLLFLSFPLLITATAPPPSTFAASQSLKLHGGYFLSAASLASSVATSWNGTGTVLAPPDSAFSVLHNRRPSLYLLLSHTLKHRLTWQDFSARAHHELPTWQHNRCLRNSISAVKIVFPNIYVDDHLTVHGIDRLLDPVLMPRCSFPNPTVDSKSHLLDLAARVLTRKGFGVVATALTIKKPELLKFDHITVFAMSDSILFSQPNGFHYDFLRHVVPKRFRIADVKNLKAVHTLSQDKTITVGSSEDGFSEIYYNSWIAVISVGRNFDDSGEFFDERPASMMDGVYGEEDVAVEWRRPDSLVAEKKLCDAADYLFCPARERDYEHMLRGSKPFVSGKMVESAPSHQMNNEQSDAVSRRLSEVPTADIGRQKPSGEAGLGGNSETRRIQFQVADDLFYYT